MIDFVDLGMTGAAVPRNKLGITALSTLAKATADFTALRLAELQTAPIRGGFDSVHLQEIHHHLFQDIYDWAGELRGIDANDLPTAHLEKSLNSIFDRLARQNHLKGYGPEDWARHASGYLYDLGILQPFLAGSDVACREFAAELALKNDLALRWNGTLDISNPVAQLRLPEEAANIRRIMMLAMDAFPNPHFSARAKAPERGIEASMSLDKIDR
jgi:cell filamentation protein